ncbi:MAG: hypothetical protein JJT82_05795 [Legionellaceae bacterium]|nr:hypothetical protein [Legionellaceae bacterium]
MAIQIAVVIVIMLLSTPYYSGDLAGGLLIRAFGIIVGCAVALLVGLWFPSHAFHQLKSALEHLSLPMMRLIQALRQENWPDSRSLSQQIQTSLAAAQALTAELRYESLFLTPQETANIERLGQSLVYIHDDLQQIPALIALTQSRDGQP